MNKLDCYKHLFEIRDTKNKDIESYIKEMAGHDNVPSEVLRFINSNTDVPELSVYNEIYNKRHKNKLYKNLMNESQSRCEKAIALSSYLTKVLISINMLGTGQDEVQELCSEYNTEEVISALRDYSNGIDCESIDTIFDKVKEKFKEIFPSTDVDEKGDE